MNEFDQRLVEAPQTQRLVDGFAQLALDAAVVIMAIYSTRGCVYKTKADRSPVSEADEKAEAIILAGLEAIAPGIPVLAEESVARGIKPAVDGRFILVDPLDGTKEFVSGNGDFTVNIALIEGGHPVVGAVYAPARGRLWWADTSIAETAEIRPGERLGEARARHRIACRTAPTGALVALASRSHGNPRTEAFLDALPIADRRSAGSSLKFCTLAEGEADVYPRFGPTMEWDTAAGDAILRAAGGTVLALGGGPLGYGKVAADYRNEGFVAWGDLAAARTYGAG